MVQTTRKSGALWLVVICFILLVLTGFIQGKEAYQLPENHLDQIIIPADGSAVLSNISLDNNKRYTITISGTYRYDAGEPGEFADAQYREDDNDQWTIRHNSVEFDGIRLASNDNAYNEEHIYTFYITGKGQPLSFRIYDNGYSDNDGSLTVTITSFQPGTDRDPYANIVLGYQALGSRNTHTDPATVLGSPSCGTFDLSLGGGWVAVDMGENEEIIDGEGDDFRVYESDPGCSGGGASKYAVFVSENPSGPWTEIGAGKGVTSFDLSASGLSIVRYVRIEDRDSPSPRSTPGADIDAIEAIYLKESDPATVFELTLPFNYEPQRHYDTITSFFDHNFPGAGTTTPQPPDYEIAIYTGEVAQRSVGQCTNPDLPIYQTAQGQCIAYDGHNGFDYDLEVDDVITAAASGTITNICDTCIIPSSLIVIEHEVKGEQYVTWYGHIALDDQLQQEWENSHSDPTKRKLEVNTSRTLGTITSQAGHLHFTVKHDNNYTDPYGWLLPNADPLLLHNGETSQCLWRFGCGVNAQLDLITGGAFRSGTGDVFVTVPPYVYSEQVTYHIAAVPAILAGDQERPTDRASKTKDNEVDALASAGHAFVLLATDAQGDSVASLSAPIELRVAYDGEDLRGIDEDSLDLFRWDHQTLAWLKITDSSQPYEGFITGQTMELGSFALLGQPHYENYFPAVVK